MPVTRTPASKTAAQTPASAAQGLERALDPFTNAIKRAAEAGAELASNLVPNLHHETPPKAVAQGQTGPGKPGLAVSPLAVPLPDMPPVGGVQIATAQADSTSTTAATPC